MQCLKNSLKLFLLEGKAKSHLFQIHVHDKYLLKEMEQLLAKMASHHLQILAELTVQEV